MTSGITVIACEEINHIWEQQQLEEIKLLWAEDYTINQLSKYFRRSREDVVIALIEVLTEKQKLDLFGIRWGVRAQEKRTTFVCMD